jgi:methyl-accepting chemotaxis protein
MVADFRRDVGEIVMSVGAEADRMGGTAQALNNVAVRAEQTADSARVAASDASVNIRTVSVAAEELAASVTEIAHQIGSASQSASKAAGIARETDANISSLVELSSRVGAIVETIGAIARQTNLLALNATIEAARAGEAGKGFAVVAAEVKTLAGHTAKATEDVAAQVAAIQGATHKAGQDIRAITAAVSDIDALTGAVSNSVAQQNEATNEIASAISRASSSSASASDDVAQVATVIGETSAEAHLVSEATDLLSASARKLSATVEAFLRDVTQDVKERRIGTRRRTTQAIVVLANGRRLRTKLADVSDTGAKIFAPEELRETQRFQVEFEDGGSVGAQMVWNKGGFAGVQFDRPLEAVDERFVA